MARRYAFGPFLLDERERRLTRNGQVVHLQPKSFEVLLYLLEHAGNLVEKNEILDAVWRDSIVTENSLTVCIRQIRIALEDNAEAPDFIETLPTAIFGSVKQGIKPNIMALSTLMLMVSIFFVTISYFVGKMGSKTTK